MLFPEYLMSYPYIENYMPVKKPPTLYSIMNSLVNFNSEEKTKIIDLPAKARDLIFDFDYWTFPKELVDDELIKSEKQKFVEEQILNHFIERRIGFETVTSFKIHLKERMNQLMPMFIPLFDVLTEEDYFIMYDEYKEITHNETTSGETSGGTINKYSDTPQGQLSRVSNDTYLTDYRDISVSGEDSGTKDFDEYYRTIRPKEAFMQMLALKNSSILENLFSGLECLFYQLD